MTLVKNVGQLPTKKIVMATIPPIVESKTPPVPFDGKEKVEKGQSLDERLLRLDQLFELQSKYNTLHSTKQKLNDFKLNKNGDTIILSLEDGTRRNDFETKNLDVIKVVIETIQQTIDNKIKAIEPLLQW